MRTLPIVILLAAVATACGGETRSHDSFADEMEAKGYLRPWLPSYLPRGLSPSDAEELSDANPSHIVVIWYSAQDAPELTIVRNFDDTTPLPIEVNNPIAPCSPNPDEGRECLPVLGDDDAELEILQQDPGGDPWVDASLDIDAGTSDVAILLNWPLNDVDWDMATSRVRGEILKIAESLDLSE